jgi:large subunit ribosomal protein L20
MSRAKRGFKLRRRHKKVLKLAKGYRGARSKLYRSAIIMVRRALCYAFRDRRVRKRQFRRLWIQRINAASRLHGLTYSQFVHALKKHNITIDRKQLAEMAVRDGSGFSALVQKVNH